MIQCLLGQQLGKLTCEVNTVIIIIVWLTALSLLYQRLLIVIFFPIQNKLEE